MVDQMGATMRNEPHGAPATRRGDPCFEGPSARQEVILEGFRGDKATTPQDMLGGLSLAAGQTAMPSF